jgi:hypothetical protein
MEGREDLGPSNAEVLTADLRTSLESVRMSINTLEEVQGKVELFFDENNILPPSEEGLEDDVNELYKLWRTSPDASELIQKFS